jgi:serine/threonine-protein kinase
LLVEEGDPNIANGIPRIPGYELLEPIGAGSMGIIYRARQLQPPRLVAIKVLIRLATDQTATLTRRYERESKLMASLHHPNVVAMFDCGKLFGAYYLVMEYVAGSTLRTHMKPEEPWRASRAAAVLDTVARALSYIHDQGVLHLDLKPENILCDEAGTIKITDFGLALLQIDAKTLAELGTAQGTADYCAPEQRFGLPVDARSDLYSLATVAYELLTGRLPGRVYLPCAPGRPELSARVDEVLERGLARDPEERYASVSDFRSDLAAALQPYGNE